ncbi:MAG: glycosyltransferase [Patescibacteria group bacterium]
MKILQVNQYYYPRGGADKYFLDLSLALKEAGHEVAVFAMKHPKNLESKFSPYFVSRVSFNNPSLKDKLKTPGRVLYSLEAKRKFTKLLTDFKPDIIHIHNIYHHLSPSILDAAKKKGIPVVMHLHDYKLICPNHMLFTKGKYCEECFKTKYYRCFKNKCVKNSYAASALASLEMYLHHNILKIYEKNVDLFIAPSQFMKDTVVRFGQDEKKIEVIYNPHNLPKEENIKSGNDNNLKAIDNYFLYFGRLSEEKGLINLIEAASLSGQKIVIAGTGPEEDHLKKISADLKAPVEFIGLKNSSELIDIIKNSQAVVIPSIWAENMPLSLMEALSLHKIAIASNMGGLPEVIHDEENGLIFEAGNSKKLADRINYLNSLPLEMRESLEKAAGETANLFSAQKNLKSVLEIYNRLIQS